MNRIYTPEHMVEIPEGPFLMGVTRNEIKECKYVPGGTYLDAAFPQREVHMSRFYIDAYPVTNRHYADFINETGYRVPQPLHQDCLEHRGYGWNVRRRTYPAGTDDYPVIFVSWYDAMAYAEWKGKRLPSEAEWEKAARGTDGRPYPWGWDANLAEHCHVYPGAGGHPTRYRDDLRPVNAHPSGVSPYGCHDMLGNVQEWCADWYDETYYARMPDHDPAGPANPRDIQGVDASGPDRVCRGGGRFDPMPHVCDRDIPGKPWTCDYVTGFRCALSP